MTEPIRVYSEGGKLVVRQGENTIKMTAAQALALAEEIIKKAKGE